MKNKTKKEESQEVKITFGADPEIFIFDNQEGIITSAIEVLRRNKYNPFELSKYVNFYYDNCMAEFTVRPADSKEDFVKSIGESLELINLFLNKEYNGRYSIKIQSSHSFEQRFLENEEALKVGCNPEYNADTVSEVVPPDFSGPSRSAGAHYAIGSNDLGDDHRLASFQSKIDLVKLFDYFVAIPFTLIDNDPTSMARRAIYGRKASHRIKPEYGSMGLEYRVLGNLWLNSPKLVGLVYDLASYSIDKLIENNYEKIINLDPQMAAAAIQENNKELALEILEIINFPKKFMIRLNQLKNVKSWNYFNEWNLKSFTSSIVAMR